MTIRKSLRFEVFARDKFVCQYCGQRPPDVVLEIDHIHPESKGGTDDSLNLITACDMCNRGKSDRLIAEVAPRPDADLAYLKMAQERAEIERYLDEKKRQNEILFAAIDGLVESWHELLTEDFHPKDRVTLKWIRFYGPDEVERSIIIASRSYVNGRFGYNSALACDNLIRFVAAILRNRRNERPDAPEGG